MLQLCKLFLLHGHRKGKLLYNGMGLVIWLPMPEISESIAVFNRIVAVSALVILARSILWALFVSDKFTRPILRMNRAAKKISAQDFSEILDTQGNDELTELAASINEISEKLSGTINELNERNQRLEMEIINEKKLDKMRREFVAGVSHELKTPIFLIQGYAEGLKKVAHKEEKRDFYCDVIMTETEKMDKLIKDRLDLSQIESGTFKISCEAFDVAELSEESLAKISPLFKAAGIVPKVDIKTAAAVFADPIRTEQIIVNFIKSAIDYGDGERIIRLSVTEEENFARISVYNTGKEIAEDELDKIWLPFYKNDKSREKAYGGTGLGLSIVKAIQEGQKSGYGVNNTGDGVEFWITLTLV